MGIEELNFKRLASDKHRVYRILRAGSNVVDTYKHNMEKIGKYAGAIIFPEQFIAMGDQYIYGVGVGRHSQFAVNVSIARYGPFKLYDCEHKLLTSVDDVIATEIAGKVQSAGWSSKGNAFFVLRNNSTTVPDINLSLHVRNGESYSYWFSNKNDAMKFGKSQLLIP